MALETNFACPAGTMRYVWREGDTVKKVAMAFGTTVAAMMDANPGVDFMSAPAGTNVCVPSRALTCPGAELYAIRAGDTLYDIAKRYGISAETLMEMNPYVEPTQLSIGQYICVPKKATGTPEPAYKACAATDIVRCGETLYDVLLKYGLSYAEFAALNPALAKKPLLPGQKYAYPLRACACGEDGKYTLQEGDTISSVASAAGIAASELMRRNPRLKPEDFAPGTEICLTYSRK